MKSCFCGHPRWWHRNIVNLEGERHTNCLTWGCKCEHFYEAAE